MKGKLTLLIFIGLIIGCNENSRSNSQQIKNGIQMAKRIKIDELKSQLIRLEKDQTEFDFIGITSNGKDCIYFIYENGKFNIEFEAIIESQVPYIEKLNEFAKSSNFETENTTYNNKTQYKSDKPAPVLRINTKTNIDKIVEIGQFIQHQIFKNNKETVYDVVP
ncbi:MAG: hypothetical protein KA536_16830 [Saprospiraceae bacterium]|nr:hypothetical protein [Saprospiraceae bacterium]